MKKHITLSLIALLLVGFATVAMRSDEKPKLQIPALVGRYQLYIPGNAAGFAILLDTTTGKTWQREQYNEVIGEPSAWIPTGEKLDNAYEIEIWASKQIAKPNKPADK